jgi:hypothetical protein
MQKVLLLLFAVCALSCGVARAQLKPCSQAENLQAENEAVTLRTWDALYKSYRLYARCNNADAAEGYSESVARILVDRWETLHRFSELAVRDKGFREFVLGHVDATLDMTDVRTIRTNAIRRCPAALGELCKDLRKEAEAAIQEDASVGNTKQ